MSNLEDITVLKYLGLATSLKVSIKVELKKLLAELYSIGGDWIQVQLFGGAGNLRLRTVANRAGLQLGSGPSGGIQLGGGGIQLGGGAMQLGGGPSGGMQLGGGAMQLGGGRGGMQLGGGGPSGGMQLGGGGMQLGGGPSGGMQLGGGGLQLGGGPSGGMQLGGGGLQLGGGGLQLGGGMQVLGGGPVLGKQRVLQQQPAPSKYDRIDTSIKLIQGALFGTDEPDIPGLYLFKTALEKFGECVNQIRSQGESACDSFLPSCQYLKGILVMLLENHAYWEAKIAGEKPSEFIKNLELPDVSRSDSTAQPNQMSPAAHPQVFVTPQVQLGGSPAAVEPVASPSPEVMGQEEPLIVNIALTDRLHSCLINLWKNKGHADVTLIVKNKRIQAHKIILASRSEYFDRLVFGNMKERDLEEIEIKEVENVDLFEDILEYAYTGSITITGDIQTMFDVLNLADRFGFLLLKNALGAVLAKKVSAQNALKFLPAADAYCIDALREKCLEQLDEISSSILSSEEFESLDPLLVKMIVSRETFDAPEIEIFECLIKIIKKVSMESSEALEFLLTCINLSAMDTNDIFSRVEPTGFFTDTVILQGVRGLTRNDLNLIRGRGVKVSNFNVLSTASCSIYLRYLQQQRRNTAQPPPALVDGIVDLHKQSPTVTLTLNKPYLANGIKLEVFPTHGIQGLSRPANDRNMLCIVQNQVDGLKFSFSLKISKDNLRWITLANYEAHECMGEVLLVFPTQAMRYIKFDLMKDVPFSVRFHECIYKELKYKPRVGVNGVSAPVQEIEPLACQSLINKEDSEVYKALSKLVPSWNPQVDEGILVFLCQPYYITDLRFEISEVSSPVSVFVSHAKTSGYQEMTCAQSMLDNSSSYSSTFSPSIVSYVFVFIPNANRTIENLNAGPQQSITPTIGTTSSGSHLTGGIILGSTSTLTAVTAASSAAQTSGPFIVTASTSAAVAGMAPSSELNKTTGLRLGSSRPALAPVSGMAPSSGLNKATVLRLGPSRPTLAPVYGMAPVYGKVPSSGLNKATGLRLGSSRPALAPVSAVLSLDHDDMFVSSTVQAQPLVGQFSPPQAAQTQANVNHKITRLYCKYAP